MMYLEDFMELIESLPDETRQRLSEIRQLDLQVRNGLEAFTNKTESFFARCMTLHDTATRDREFAKIKQEFTNIVSECDEKVQIAQQHHELLERYLKKIDQEIQKFKMELEADNAGITGQIEDRFKEAERSLDQFIIDHAKTRVEETPRARFGAPYRDLEAENGDSDLRHSDVDSPFLGGGVGTGTSNCDGDAESDFSSFQSQFPFANNNFDSPAVPLPSQHSHSLRNAGAPKGRYAALHAGASTQGHPNAPASLSSAAFNNSNTPFANVFANSAYSGANTPLNSNAFDTASVSSSTNTNGTRKRPKNSSQTASGNNSKKGRQTNAGSHFYGNQYTGSLKPKTGKQQFGTPSNFASQAPFSSPQTSLSQMNSQSSANAAYAYPPQFGMQFPPSGYPDQPNWPSSVPPSQAPGVGLPHDLASPGDDAVEYYDAEGNQEDSRLYCTCQRVSFGNMVACDSDNCKYEWFHYDCVGLTAAPKGKWFCVECSAARKQRNKQSTGAPRTSDASAASFSRKPTYKHSNK